MFDHVHADVIAQDCNSSDLGNDYRFGFNGQMKDNNLKGVGNSLDFSFRIHDARLGRFLSLDPLAESYPWNSPYAFAENRVIDGRDLESREWKAATTENATKFTTKIVVVNKSTLFTANDVQQLKTNLETAFNTAYSKQFEGHQYQANLEYGNSSSLNSGTIVVVLKDAEVKPDRDGNFHYAGGETVRATGENRASQQNNINLRVSVNGKIREMEDIVTNALHEIGHTGGLPHIWDSESPEDARQPTNVSNMSRDDKAGLKKNLMNSEANPKASMIGTFGRDVTKGQFERINTIVEKEQSK